MPTKNDLGLSMIISALSSDLLVCASTTDPTGIEITGQIKITKDRLIDQKSN